MKNKLTLFFILTLVAKMLLALALPLTTDETYYFLWGKYLSLSYFDHPPMTGWMMALSQPFKEIAPGAIRWPFILVSHATIAIWLLIIRPWTNQKTKFWFLVTAVLNPLWGLGGMIATPDIPLMFFWSAAIYVSLQLIKKPSLINYSLLGVVLGAGFLSKYHIVLFIPSLLWFIIASKQIQKLFSLKTLATLVDGLIVCLPVLIWNSQNDWASFAFQWAHGMSGKYWHGLIPLEYLGSQILIIFPSFLYILFLHRHEVRRHPLWPFAVFPLLFFLYSSFKGRVEANWTIPAYPAIYALCLIFISNQKMYLIRWTNYLWGGVVVIALGLILSGRPGPLLKTNLYDAQKFAPLLEFARSHQPVRTYSYQLSGYLSFHLNQLQCKLPVYGRVDHFHFMEECKTLPDRFFYIMEGGYTPPIEEDLPGYRVISEQKLTGPFKALEVIKK